MLFLLKDSSWTVAIRIRFVKEGITEIWGLVLERSLEGILDLIEIIELGIVIDIRLL